MPTRHPNQIAPKSSGDRATHVTVMEGMSGYFAVVLWHNPYMGGFWEPWDTGIGRHASCASAVIEAKQLAKDLGLPFVDAPTQV